MKRFVYAYMLGWYSSNNVVVVGITRATITLMGEKESEVELIVDTGSILTWVKRGTLQKIGVKPRWEKEFRTIEGRIIKRKTGLIAIRHDGAEAGIEVVFGDRGDAEVLGVTALEGLGMEVDPVTRVLKRTSLLAI